jgi:hypothetical protein
MDNFSYPDSRYINASIDFSTRAKGGTYIQHLSRLPGNNSPIFSKAAGDGLITINDNEVHDVLIKVSDAAGNTSNLRFKIKLNPTAVQNSMSITNWVPMPPGQPNEWKLDNIEAFFTSRAFYDTVPFFHQAREASNALVVQVGVKCSESVGMRDVNSPSIAILLNFNAAYIACCCGIDR